MTESLPIEHLAAFRDYLRRSQWTLEKTDGMQAVVASKRGLSVKLVCWYDGKGSFTAESVWAKAELMAFKGMHGIE